MRRTVKEAFITSIPILLGYVVLGMAFGILLQSKGYGILYAFLMSVFIYAGSMQFVCIQLLTSGATLISAAIMTVLINARHLVYGLSMLDKYKDMGSIKPYMIFSLTDETYSVLVSQETPKGCNQKYYMFFVSFFNQCYWVIGSMIGSTIGALVHFNTLGIDFAMTALFVVIVVNQIMEHPKQLYSLMGFSISIIALLLFGPSSFIIPAMIGIIASLTIFYKKGVKNYE